MLRESVRDFLKENQPFSLLDDAALDWLAQSLTIQVYPAGVHILRQGRPASRSLFIVKEGTVRLYVSTPAGGEQVLDFRSAGDTFGFLARDESEGVSASVQAVGDTVCYVAEGATVAKLLNDHPELGEYLLPGYFPRRGPEASRTPLAQSLLHDGSERALFTTPVRHLARREVLAVRADATIAQAAELMATHRVGSLVVTDPADTPIGIVTTTDLRDRVLVARRDPSGEVGTIMSAPLLTVGAADFCFEALLKMMSHNVHHLPVLEGKRLLGILSNHDLMVLQGTSPLVIAREIEGQDTVEGLAASCGKIKGLVSLLLREGAGAGGIIRVISAVNDRLEHRMLDLALATLGPSPVGFCWLVYGSAGRKEQTFKTDQDNAIVYADPRNPQEAGAAQEYFGRFADFVVDGFQRCGFSWCRGNFMASNPRWRQPLSAWKRDFSDWILSPDEAAIQKAANLFDFRGLHGDLGLAAALKAHLRDALVGQTRFLHALASSALAFRPPLGLFGSLQVEKSGEHANQVDLKRCCLTPLINVVRLHALESNLSETSTIERLAVLRAAQAIPRARADDLAHAFEFLSLLRIRHQHEQIAMGLEPDNFIDPRSLTSLELRTLKEICRVIVKALDAIALKYQVEARS
jgi:CBS domain-containing protein